MGENCLPDCVNSDIYRQVIAILKKLQVVFLDCDSQTVFGNCDLCAVGGDASSVSVSFNPASNALTVVVDGNADTVELVLNAGDIVTTSDVTIGGTIYNAGTSVQTVIEALVALIHPPASLTNNVGAFTWNSATQAGNIPATPTVVYNSVAGTVTYNPNNGGAAVVFPVGYKADTILTTAVITVQGVSYPIGSNVQTILDAINATTFADSGSIEWSVVGPDNVAIVAGADTAALNDYPKSDGAGGIVWGPITSVGISRYSAGNGAFVTATGLGITFVRTTASVWTFNIPAGVEILSFDINNTPSESATVPLSLDFVFAGTRIYNQNTSDDMTDAMVPIVTTLEKIAPATYPSTAAGNNPAWTASVPVAGTLRVETLEFSEVGNAGANSTLIKGVF